MAQRHPQRSQPRQLGAELDSLGDEEAADLVGVPAERLDQGGAVVVGVDAADQRAVELHVVGGEHGDLAQPGVAGADVVDGDPHPVRAQRRDRVAGLEVVLDQRLLGDLDHQPVEVAAERRRGLAQQLVGGAVEHRRQREVDGQPGPRRPPREQLQRLAQAGPLQLLTLAQLFGQGEPLLRAAVRAAAAEAGERLVGVDLAAAQVDDRLRRHRQAGAADQLGKGSVAVGLLLGAQRPRRAGGGGASGAGREVRLVGDAGGDVAGQQQRFRALGFEPGAAQQPVQLQGEPAAGQLQADDGDAEGEVFEVEVAEAGDRQCQRHQHAGDPDPVDAAAAPHHPGRHRDQPDQADDGDRLVAHADDQERRQRRHRLLEAQPAEARGRQHDQRGGDDGGEAGDAELGVRQQVGLGEDQRDAEPAEGEPGERRGATDATHVLVALDGVSRPLHRLYEFRQKDAGT